MERGRNYMGGKGENCHCWKAFVPTYFLKGHFNRKAPKKGFSCSRSASHIPNRGLSYSDQVRCAKNMFFLHLNRIHKNNKFFFLLRYAPYNLSRGGAFLKLAQVMEQHICNKLWKSKDQGVKVVAGSEHFAMGRETRRKILDRSARWNWKKVNLTNDYIENIIWNPWIPWFCLCCLCLSCIFCCYLYCRCVHCHCLCNCWKWKLKVEFLLSCFKCALLTISTAGWLKVLRLANKSGGKVVAQKSRQ